MHEANERPEGPMRHASTVTRIAVMAALLLNVAAAPAAPEQPLPPKAQAWVDRAGIGFWKAIISESQMWWDCGTPTPFGQRVARAKEIAEATLRAMKAEDLHVSPWGQMAVTYLESRGNPCSIGPNTRKNATKLHLLPVDEDGNPKQWTRYTREDIRAVITNPKWVSRHHVADVGLVQDVYPRYARVLDEQGNLRCLGKRSEACRLPTIDELVSVPGGAAIGVHGMLVRRWHFNTTEPWWFWPWVPRARYNNAIVGIVARMGGSLKEPFPWD